MTARCDNCENWTWSHGGWGTCSKALNGGMFTNHTKYAGVYRARHTNHRYKTNKACITRYVRRDDAECL